MEQRAKSEEVKSGRGQFIKTAEGGERLPIACTWSHALNLRYYRLLPSNERLPRAIYVSVGLLMQFRFPSSPPPLLNPCVSHPLRDFDARMEHLARISARFEPGK